MMESGMLLGWAVNICFLLLFAAISISFIRVAIGPSQADRVVALDLITVLAVAVCALVAVSSDRSAFLDVGVALALVAFMATVALARYIERRADDGTPAKNSEADS